MPKPTHQSSTRMLRNAFVLYAAEFLRFGFGIAIAALLGRYLGAANFGVYSFALSLAMFLALPLDFGFSSLSLLAAARQRRMLPKYTGNAMSLQLAAGIALVTAMALISSLWTLPPMPALLLFAGLWMLSQVLSEMLFVIFRTHERMQYEALTKILERSVFLIAVIAVVHYRWPLQILFVLLAISGMVSLTLACGIARVRYRQPVLRWDFGFFPAFLRQSWPFGLSAVFSALYFHIDTVMLYLMRDATTAGTYSAAARVLFMSFLIPGVISNASFPQLTQLLARDQPRAAQLYRSLVQYSALLGAVLAILAFAYAPDILSTLYGPEFRNGSTALRILAIVIFTKLIAMRAGDVLTAGGKQATRMRVQGCSAFANVVLNLVLIPAFGAIGAATATLLSELYLAYGYFRNAAALLPLRISASWMMRFGVLLCGTLAFTLLLPTVPWAVHAALTILVAFVLALGTRLLTLHALHPRRWFP